MVYNTTHNNRMGPEAQMRLIFSCSAQNHLVPSGVFLLAMLMQIHLGMEPRINSVFLLLFSISYPFDPSYYKPQKKVPSVCFDEVPSNQKNYGSMNFQLSSYPISSLPNNLKSPFSSLRSLIQLPSFFLFALFHPPHQAEANGTSNRQKYGFQESRPFYHLLLGQSRRSLTSKVFVC